MYRCKCQRSKTRVPAELSKIWTSETFDSMIIVATKNFDNLECLSIHIIAGSFPWFFFCFQFKCENKQQDQIKGVEGSCTHCNSCCCPHMSETAQADKDSSHQVKHLSQNRNDIPKNVLSKHSTLRWEKWVRKNEKKKKIPKKDNVLSSLIFTFFWANHQQPSWSGP